MPKDLLGLLGGTTVALLRARRKGISLRYVLFKPFESPEDVFFRTTSIFIAPPICLLFSIGAAVYAGFYFLVASTMPKEDNYNMIDSAKDLAELSIQFLFASVLASLVNLIDLLVSVVSTLANNLKAEIHG